MALSPEDETRGQDVMSVIGARSSGASMQSPVSGGKYVDWSHARRRRHRRRWRRRLTSSEALVILQCCVILIANYERVAAATTTTATSTNDRSHQQVIVFPGIRSNGSVSFSQQAAKQPRNDYSAATIYVNPNPSTRSRRPSGTGTGQSSSGPIAISRSLNSIGKDEQSQVAEWPFFKSLQVVRNNQQQSMIGRKVQVQISAEEQQRQSATSSPSPATMTTPSMMVSLMKQLTPAAKRVFSNAHTSEESQEPSTAAPKGMAATVPKGES